MSFLRLIPFCGPLSSGDREDRVRIVTHIGLPARPTGPERHGSVFNQEREHLPCGTFTAQSAFVDDETAAIIHGAERIRSRACAGVILACAMGGVMLIAELVGRLP